jgi:hypothetical protein
MSCYISSNANRLYAGAETNYGKVPASAAASRFPAVKLSVQQTTDQPVRRDKTGTRTFLGSPAGVRKVTKYALKTYLTALPDGDALPGYGPLIEAAMGNNAEVYSGGTVASVSNGTRVQFGASHGLSAGQAIAVGGEIRFATAVVSANTVEVNAPFSATPAAGTAVTRTVTYRLGDRLGSASIFDYWTPAEAIQRVVSGVAVDQFTVRVNADYHEFEFRGPARDVIDSASFEAGQGELSEFPEEPESDSFDYSIIPGHLGQVWLGMNPDRFYTLTDASVKVDNEVDMRAREFGLEGPRCIVAGQRRVTTDLELLASDDEQTTSLYQAARQRSPIQAMIQLGQQSGQLMGIYMSSVIPVVPEFDDSEPRLLWKFKNCRAQGAGDDEIVIAFA